LPPIKIKPRILFDSESKGCSIHRVNNRITLFKGNGDGLIGKVVNHIGFSTVFIKGNCRRMVGSDLASSCC
jgi:hypothetical protein